MPQKKSCTKIYKTPAQKFVYTKKKKQKTLKKTPQTHTAAKATQKNPLWTDPEGATTLKLMCKVLRALDVPRTKA